MKKENNKNTGFENLEKFQVEKMKNEELYMVNGGCTCGTTSVCHIDGTTDGDTSIK